MDPGFCSGVLLRGFAPGFGSRQEKRKSPHVQANIEVLDIVEASKRSILLILDWFYWCLSDVEKSGSECHLGWPETGPNLRKREVQKCFKNLTGFDEFDVMRGAQKVAFCDCSLVLLLFERHRNLNF